MNKIKILTLLALTTLFASCYKDQSTAGYKRVSPITVVNESSTDISLYSLDTLRITPIAYKEGQSDSKLQFSWTLYNSNITPTVIGTQMTLKALMNFQPMGAPYVLIYRVTDPDSGLFVETKYSVTVMSPFGTGLIVCDSHDGISSDVSLCMSKNFKTGYPQDTVMRNLFSRVNDRKIEGIITGAVSTYYGTFATLTISTPKAIERVDPRDYTFVDKDGGMFYHDPGVYNVQALLNDANSGYDIMNNNGKIYMRSFQQGNRLYGYHFSMPDMSETYISKVHKPYWNAALCFDEVGGRFLGLNNSYNRFDNIKVREGDYFQYTGYKDYECLAIFDGNNNRTHAVMKNKTTGRVQVYSFGNDTKPWPYEVFAQWIYDLDPAICPEIDKARFFCSTESAQAIYYATEDKIYMVSIVVPTDLVTTVEYTAPEGEIITHLYPWINYRAGGQVDYTNPNPGADKPILQASAKNRMLVVSTYNESTREGFVNTVAIANMSSGKLEQNRELHKRFGGFGRISITTFQEK